MDNHLRASDPAVHSLRACRWHFESGAERAAAVQALGRSNGGSIQYFVDAEQPALLLLTLAGDGSANGEPAALPNAPTAAEVEWTAEAELVARWSADRPHPAGCLVVVRQPLVRPDRDAQRDWVATVLRALNGEQSPPKGLLTASFFASRDGGFVLNLAEWTSAEAHRQALKRGSYGRHGSIGSSALWRATREHPAVTSEHEVHRYLPSDAASSSARAA
jgi:hypothetical protein